MISTRAFAITKMKFKEKLRNMKSTAIVFVIPFVFMSIFGIVFGANSESITFDLAVIESDDVDYNNLRDVIYEIENETGDKLFKYTEFESFDEVETKVATGEYDLAIEWDGEAQSVISHVSEENTLSQLVSGIVRDIVDGYFQVESSRLQEQPVRVDVGTDDPTPYQFLVPGLLVYGIMILMPLAAGDFSNMIEKKQIFRYFTSKTGAVDIFTGYLIYLIAMAVIQLTLMFGVASMYGFEANGNPVFPLIVIGLPMILFTVGLGLVFGSMTKDSDAASNLGTMASIILGFLSGAFIGGIDSVLTLNIGDTVLKITDLIPSYHASEAMRDTLLYGADMAESTDRIAYLLVSSVIIFTVGVYLFKRNRLRALG